MNRHRASTASTPGWTQLDLDNDYHALKTPVRCFDYASLNAQEIEILFAENNNQGMLSSTADEGDNQDFFGRPPLDTSTPEAVKYTSLSTARDESDLPAKYTVVQDVGAVIRRDIELESEKLKVLQFGDVVDVLEITKNSIGLLRARTTDGWTTLTDDDQPILQKISPQHSSEALESSPSLAKNKVVLRRGHDQYISFVKFSGIKQELVRDLGPLSWMVDNPGKQSALLTGSFHPITAPNSDFMQAGWWAKTTTMDSPDCGSASSESNFQSAEDAPIALLLCGTCPSRGYFSSHSHSQAFADMAVLGCSAVDACHALEPSISSMICALGSRLEFPAMQLLKALLSSVMTRFRRAILNLLCNRVTNKTPRRLKCEHLPKARITPIEVDLYRRPPDLCSNFFFSSPLYLPFYPSLIPPPPPHTHTHIFSLFPYLSYLYSLSLLLHSLNN